jgi:Ca-activated chloride channel homolog
LARLTWLFALSCGLLALPARTAPPEVDALLVLAIDSSSSVNRAEFALQMEGLAAAFRDAGVHAAMTSGPKHSVAVALMEWSDPNWQRVGVPWRILRNADDALKLADEIDTTPRLIDGGGTALGNAVSVAVRMIQTAPIKADRKIIDISGDGAQNLGRALAPVRATALTADITLNGLAIINEEPDLEDYYRDALIGGPDAFVLRAANYEDFTHAIRQKLIRELSVPIAKAPQRFLNLATLGH